MEKTKLLRIENSFVNPHWITHVELGNLRNADVVTVYVHVPGDQSRTFGLARDAWDALAKDHFEILAR